MTFFLAAAAAADRPFLVGFIRGHALLQKQVFDRLDWFLDFPLCRPDMIRSLTSLFRDNQRLCMAIKESQIAKLVRMLADYNTKIPNMLELLNFIVKIDSIDLPLKRNQNFVLSNMLQRRSDTLLLVENNDNERRINVRRWLVLSFTDVLFGAVAAR